MSRKALVACHACWRVYRRQGTCGHCNASRWYRKLRPLPAELEAAYRVGGQNAVWAARGLERTE